MAHYSNVLLTLVALGVPAYLALRSKRFGVPLGAAALWLLVFLCGAASETWSPSFLQEEHLFAVRRWFMGGWVFGLAYGYLFWLMKQSLLMFRRGRPVYREPFQS